ncbi:A nuclease family of the HNH/ENDO VII superfamily with conserved AHH [Sphingomonas guangdongensis]|uniref:A nuclease family of the HNH/ENDO VII superfamily with conserved AHH n=1 Tax=Sphingomonas guangdongensis TaxID=1141890 RepID=A0A285R7J4_9SPHN|nr:AHH domain-containing protein [Sphingomonas guangdongensis]SOB88327.1 A nuclease family of the HNH/ENDO VII superfamily with conserved AHH [Sphingomonas guangdongensis]
MSLSIATLSRSSSLGGSSANNDLIPYDLSIPQGAALSPIAQGNTLRGFEQFGADALGGRVQLAQAGAATLPLGGGGVAIPRGSVRLPGGPIATAAQVMEMLRGLAEFRQIEGVIDRFKLDRNNAADLLGARAFVWATYKMPLLSDMPFSGAANGRGAQAVMAYERAHPGATLRADRGDVAAQRALIAVANDAVANPNVVERRSAVSPALSTHSTNARALVAAGTRMQNWQAHHLIPFAEIANLPPAVQIAIARSGWKLDSAENLMALPADRATYVSPPNSGLRPIHNSAHPAYSADVAARLGHLRANGATMTDAQIRLSLSGIERAMTASLLNPAGGYHPTVR